MTVFKFLAYLVIFVACTNSSLAQWSRSNETVRLTNGADKIWVNDVAPIGGGTYRLYLNGDPGSYGNLLVNLNADNMSSSEALLKLSANNASSTSAKMLYGTHGGSTSPVFEFIASGRLNLLDPSGNFSRALEVRGDEALWYDSDYFSWGFGGNWNRFARPVTLGGSTEPPSGTALLITGSSDIRMDGTGARLLKFHNGFTEEGFVGFSDNSLTIQNSIGEYVLIRSNGKDQLFIGEDASLFGDLNISGAINGISDRRTKKNIRPIASALQSILALEGKTFEFKTEQFPKLDLPPGLHFGLIAQEVEQVVPELVSSHTQVSLDNEYIDLKGVEYQAVIPLLIEAIKEQNQLITALRLRIDNLEDKISSDLK